MEMLLNFSFFKLKDKKEFINNIQSCLNAMNVAHIAADERRQLHSKVFTNKNNKRLLLVLEHVLDCRAKLNYLVQVHATAFYLKKSTSVQIKDAFTAGLKLSRSNVADSVNAFKIDIIHEQSFIGDLASATHILRKLDNTASITMSSKLAYQLTKLSN